MSADTVSDAVREFAEYFPPNPTKHGRLLSVKTNADGVLVKKVKTYEGERVTEELIARHLQGNKNFLALGQLPGDTTGTTTGMIDLDTKDYQGPGDLDAALLRLVDVASTAGMSPYLEESTRGGTHVHIFASERMPHDMMNRGLRELVDRAAMPKTEVFPAGDDHTSTWYIMPNAGAESDPKRLGRTFLSTVDSEAIPYDELSEWIVRTPAHIIRALAESYVEPTSETSSATEPADLAPEAIAQLKGLAETPPQKSFERHGAMVAFINLGRRCGRERAMVDHLKSETVRKAWVTDGSRDAKDWGREVERWTKANKGERQRGISYLRGQGFDVPTLPKVEVAQDHEADPERITQEITDFPLEVYPERLVLFIKAAAAALPAPPDFLAVAMLAALGSAIGISREIKLKDSWREGGRFFVAIVADPGSKKSPALALATAPLKELQRAYNKAHRKALEEYERKKQEYEKAKADKRNSTDTPEPPGAEPELAQCLTTDATVEALMSLHVKNLRSLMLYQDELSGWVTGMGQYKGGKGNDLQKWLSIWSGAQVIINRKGKQAEVLDDPFINVAGCIPPDILPTLETSEGSDGFIDRILFCYPRGVRPSFNPKDDIPQELKAEYQKVFDTLRKLEPSVVDETPQPKTLEMTPEALELFTLWANEHSGEADAPGFDRRLRGAWAKLEGYCARFALVLHLTAYAAGEETDERISLTSIRKAAALTDYFKSHARRVYGQLKGDPLDKILRTVYEYIDRQPKRRCTLRDLTRANLPGCTTAKGTRGLLQKLTAAKLGRLEEITHPNGRKGEAYVLTND